MAAHSSWLEAFQRATVEPILCARINLPQRESIRVDAATTVGTLDFVVNDAGTVISLIAGTDYTNGATIILTAEAIRDAINAEDVPYLRARIHPEQTDTVEVIAGSRFFDFTDNEFLGYNTGTTITSFSIQLTGSPSGMRVLESPSATPTFVSGDRTVEGTILAGETIAPTYPNSIERSGSIGRALDATTREVSTGELVVTFHDDGWLRSLVSRQPLKGRRVDLKIGAHGLTEGNERAVVSSSAASGVLTINVGSSHGFAVGDEITTDNLQDGYNVLDEPITAIGASTVSCATDGADIGDAGTSGVVNTSYWKKIPSLFFRRIDPQSQDGKIDLVLTDALGLISEVTISGTFIGHPLAVLREVMEAGGLTNGVHFDGDTFDPITVMPEKAHWCVSRAKYTLPFDIDNRVQDESLSDLVQELLFVLGGTLAPNSKGQLTFTPFDPDAAATFTWNASEDSYQISPVDQLNSDEDATNLVGVRLFQGAETANQKTLPPQTLFEVDKESICFYGETFSQRLESRWLNGIARLAASFFNTSNQITLEFAGKVGMSGCDGWTINGGLTDQGYYPIAHTAGNLPDDGASPARRSFFRLVTTAPERQGDQHVIAVGGVVTSGVISDPTQHNVLGNEGVIVPLQLIYDVDTGYNGDGFTNGRAGFGTPAQTAAEAFNPTGEYGITDFASYAIDLTIPVDLIRRRLRRQKFGMPRLKVSAPFSEIDRVIGAIGTIIAETTFLAAFQDGLTNATKFEITSVDLHMFESPPRIEFELAFLRNDNLPILTTEAPAYFPSGTDVVVGSVASGTNNVIDSGDFVIDGGEQVVV